MGDNTWVHTRFYTYTLSFKMFIEEFSNIIQNEEQVANLLVNVENILCNKCGSEMNYYIKKDREKERTFLRCKRKGCQTT